MAAYGPGYAWVDTHGLLPTVDWRRDQAWDQVRDALVRFLRGWFSRKYEPDRPREAAIEIRGTGEVVVKITGTGRVGNHLLDT